MFVHYIQMRTSQHTAAWSHHDDVIRGKNFPRFWPFVRGIHRSPVNSPHKGQWRGALIFSLICGFGKQSWGWSFQMPPGSLWRHCNVMYSQGNVVATAVKKRHHYHYRKCIHRYLINDMHIAENAWVPIFTWILQLFIQLSIVFLTGIETRKQASYDILIYFHSKMPFQKWPCFSGVKEFISVNLSSQTVLWKMNGRVA